MRLIRTFHPIGQGAFYTERHFSKENEITIIYDCGSTTLNLKKLEKKIKSTFTKGQVIDMLFISHFHTDHINGIQFLKTHCKIKKVVLPLIDNKTKVLLKIYNFMAFGDIDTLLIDNPEAFFGNSTEVISISETNIAKDENGINLEHQIDISETNTSTIRESGLPFINSFNTEWFYIPFNYKNSNREKEFLSALEKASLNLSDIDTVEKISANKNEIKNAFKDVEGGLNINSLILFSGKQKNDYINYFAYQNHFYYDIFFKKILQCGCLFLGDIDLNQPSIVNDIKSKLVKFMPHIGSIQIPHHGSIKNFNINILESLNIQFAIFSFGTNNIYGHPSDKVIGDILSNKIYPLLVTEEQNSIVIQWV